MNAWIARDSSGDLYIYDAKPERHDTFFMGGIVHVICCLPKKMYPDVTFENSPLELIVKL